MPTADRVTAPYWINVSVGSKLESIELPGVTGEKKARQKFTEAIRELQAKYPRRLKGLKVDLMGTGHNVRVAGTVRKIASMPVCQWTVEPNTNFEWQTGPTHYYDCQRVMARIAEGKTAFMWSDYQPVIPYKSES